jgi:hypothetical protein
VRPTRRTGWLAAPAGGGRVTTLVLGLVLAIPITGELIRALITGQW